MIFINEVFAEGVNKSTEAPAFQNFTASIVPLLIFVAIFYFLLIRPQQKKQKEHEKEVASLKPNDKVLTAGGIYGTIQKVKEKSLIVEIANGVEIEVVSETVSPLKDFANLTKNKEYNLQKKENVESEVETEKNKKRRPAKNVEKVKGKNLK